jgi:hypothetical protein
MGRVAIAHRGPKRRSCIVTDLRPRVGMRAARVPIGDTTEDRPLKGDVWKRRRFHAARMRPRSTVADTPARRSDAHGEAAFH